VNRETRTAFLEAERERLVNLCFRKGGLRDHAQAQDAAQGVIAKFLESAPKKISKKAAEKWLTRVALNDCAQIFRDDKPRREAGVMYEHESKASDPYAREIDPEIYSSLDSFLAGLPDTLGPKQVSVLKKKLTAQERAVFVLSACLKWDPFEVEELLGRKLGRRVLSKKKRSPKGHVPVSEIASLLDMPQGTVRSHLARAKEKLRNELSGLDERGVRQMRPEKFPPEALISPGLRRRDVRSIFRAEQNDVVSSDVSDGDREHVRRLPGPGLPAPAPPDKPPADLERDDPTPKTSGASVLTPTRAVVRRPLDRDQTERLRRIAKKCGCFFKGCMYCGEWFWQTVYIKFTPRNVKRYKSGFDVWRAYKPKSLGWTFLCITCGAKDADCWENCQGQLGKEPRLAPKNDFATDREIHQL
jgi:RNA polymerase sigma factor (sigma-70 family)